MGGFPLAAQSVGIEPIWASEIDRAPIEITKRHFPNMKHLGDIAKIDGAKIESVDIISFGSPCQDLSVAGNQKGLAGERSVLFFEAIRIIKEMRETTNGIYPRYAIWENVLGSFSSDNGNDFRIVLENFASITETGLSIPGSGKWKHAGGILGNGWSLAWRTLDAQYWGVPQRRRRIFLVCDFRGQRAGEILFKRQGLCGYIKTRKETRESSSANIANGFRETNAFMSGQGASAGGIGYAKEISQTCVIYPNVAGTLCASGAGLNRPAGQGNETDLCIVERVIYAKQRHDEYKLLDVSNCLQARDYKDVVSLVCDYSNKIGDVVGLDCRNLNESNDICGTLQSKDGGGYSLNYIHPVRIGGTVRKLTPMECERLQGFPDGWTDGHSDSQRYKALGNSVAIPCVKYIMEGFL